MAKKKKEKSNMKKISTWFIKVFILYFLIVTVLNMVIFTFILDGVITLGEISVVQSETAYLASVIPYEEMDDISASWLQIAESYIPSDNFTDIAGIKFYGALKAVYTLKNVDGELVYGAGTEYTGNMWKKEDILKEIGTPVKDEDMTPELSNALKYDINSYGHISYDPQTNEISQNAGSVYYYAVCDDDDIIYGYLVIVMFEEYQTMTKVAQIVSFSLLFAFLEVLMMAVFIIIMYRLIRKRIISPLKKVETASREFVNVSRTEEDPSNWTFNKPKLKRHDEIDSVNDSVADMAKDMSEYMKTILEDTKEKQRIGTELELAAEIQMNALETKFPAFPNIKSVDIFAQMTPAKEVGGDFYDFFPVDDTHIGLVMADVSGKGVPASIYMMIAKIILRNIAMMGNSPSDTLTRLNEQINENNENSMFVTVWFGILDVNTGHVVATNAGHEYPVIKKKDGTYEIMKDKHGLPIGAMGGVKYRQYEFDLEKGGALFLYTDGAPEATNSADELFGMDNVVKSLNKNPERTAEELINDLKSDIDEYVGEAPQFDDLTMMAVRMLDI